MRGRASAILFPALLFAICMSLRPPALSAASAQGQNLLRNPGLSAGTGALPEGWRTTRDTPPDQLKWSHPHGQAAELEIGTTQGSHRRNYWIQSVDLKSGWYFLIAEAKTEGSESGAALKVNTQFKSAITVGGGENWKPLSLYFSIGSPGQTVQIGCGVRSEGTGKALFRNLQLVRVARAPPADALQFDLSRTPEPSVRSRATAVAVAAIAKPRPGVSLFREAIDLRAMAAALLVFTALTYLDWRYRGADERGGQGAPAEEVEKATAGAAATTGKIIIQPVWKSLGVALFLSLAFLMMWLVSRFDYIPGVGLEFVEPRATGGDAPHYLLTINSLLFDHDLQVQDDYDRVERGGLEAGVEARGITLDRQTIVVNRRTGHHAGAEVRNGLWYRSSNPEFAPGPGVYEVPAHPVGFPVLIALLLAPFHPALADSEAEAGFVLTLIAWLGVAATYFLARTIGMGRGWAMLAAGLLFAASPWLAYSRAFFAETSIGLALVLALWALLTDRPILAALGAAAAAVFKPGFAIVGACFVLDEVRERRFTDAIKIALVLGLPAIGIFAFNYRLHRQLYVSGLTWKFDPHLLYETLLSPNEGILVFAPWTIVGFGASAIHGLSFGDQGQSKDARLLRCIMPSFALYLVLLASTGFGAGYCYGPRYWVAFLPWLAVGTVQAMRKAGFFSRILCAALVLLAIGIAIPGALRYPQLFEKPAWTAWRGFY